MRYKKYTGKRRRKRSKYSHSSNLLIPLLFVVWLMLAVNNGISKERLGTYIILLALAFVFVWVAVKVCKRYIYLNSTLHHIDSMSGVQFEEYLKTHFEKLGYRVTLTKKSGDYGVDLICEKKGNGEWDKFVVQAKRYKEKVGISAVQQIIGGMSYYGCEHGYVITNNYFTKNAWELAKRSGVVLYDRNILTDKFNVKTGKRSEKT